MGVRAQRERQDAELDEAAARRAREEVEAELALEQEEKQREFSASVNLVPAELGNPLLATEDCAKNDAGGMHGAREKARGGTANEAC